MVFRFFILLLLTGTCLADDVTDALKQSSFAGVVTIVAGNQIPYKDSELSNCGSSYVAYASAKRVFVNDIGWIEGYPIEFRAASTLDLGGTYLVFLNEIAAEVKNAMLIGRELRTDRCMEGGISLVPVFIDTRTIGFDAIFQEWRSIEEVNSSGEPQSRWYFLAHSEFEDFFQPSGIANGEPLERISMEIQQFYGVTKPDAYPREAVLEMVATIACDLRGPSKDSTNDLMISQCAK